MCVNTDILEEYEEIIAQKSTPEIAQNVVEAIANLSTTTFWKASARGTLEAEGYYDAKANKVVLDGREYEYAHDLK